MSDLEAYDARTSKRGKLNSRGITRDMTGHQPFRPSPEGDGIRHRVLAQLGAADIDVAAACTSTGCRVAALLGEEEILFTEAVALAQLLGCSPAVFFDQIQDP